MTTTNDNILRGYTSQDKAYEVKDYPYGFRLRTSIFYWIETKKGNGDRFCTYTINPKTGRANKPKCSTYSPFLYLQLNEKGHVTTGTLSAYNKDVFEARFYFVLKNLYPFYISDDQQFNIRMDYLAHQIGDMPYNKVKYSADTVQDYNNWCSGLVKHIKTCPFENLVEYPAAPEQDNPDGEVKMVIKEYKEVEVKPLEHSITPEKVNAILQKALPGFYTEVREYKGMSDTYLKIAMAVPPKAQMVSLSLNLNDLVLQPQGYGGNGGQAIYREPNREDPNEKYLAMKGVRVAFRRPDCNEKAVLAAIERFALNYKKTLIENLKVLCSRDSVNYEAVLNVPA
jgi:hypothetical protein